MKRGRFNGGSKFIYKLQTIVLTLLLGYQIIIVGSGKVQGHLWGQRPQDWAQIQEKTGYAGYEYVMDLLKLNDTVNLLDVGCGSGLFSSIAGKTGAKVTGIDASDELIAQAKKRTPSIDFLTGEMEILPFADETFDVVCGFNSFQYAENVKNALAEVKRVLKNNGRLVTMIWGNKEDCEAATYLKAVGSLLPPPPPPGAPGPFALSENSLLETILTETGFKIISQADIPALWEYDHADTAIKGLISAGPVSRAIANSGFDKVYETISAAIQPYIQTNGHVVYHNTYRIIVSEK